MQKYNILYNSFTVKMKCAAYCYTYTLCVSYC